MNNKELIPFIQINDGPREIAVAWVENYRPYNSSQPEIAQKHKLASDIQNYAIEFADQEKQALKDRIIKLCRQAVADETMSTSTFASILDQF